MIRQALAKRTDRSRLPSGEEGNSFMGYSGLVVPDLRKYAGILLIDNECFVQFLLNHRPQPE
jgi:hypothetical protein